jgi:hypothetical protein
LNLFDFSTGSHSEIYPVSNQKEKKSSSNQNTYRDFAFHQLEISFQKEKRIKKKEFSF